MGFVLHDYQTTLRSRATLTGTGVHSGNSVTVH
ncbi:MAG: UDP-3-O-acyl-N-acetylglucosamine deacetylase, partial [Mesorhizobium sp.]